MWQTEVTNVFVPLLKQRLKDTFITEWRRGIGTSPTMLMFKNLKPFGISQYLLTVSNVKLRLYITKKRLSSHSRLTEYGRHRNIPRNESVISVQIPMVHSRTSINLWVFVMLIMTWEYIYLLL